MGTDPRLMGDDEGLAHDEQEAPGADRPAIDPGAPGQGISYVLTSRPQPDAIEVDGGDRVDAGEAVTGTRADCGGEAPAGGEPGEDSALEADDLGRSR